VVPNTYTPSFKVHAKSMALFSGVARFLQNLKNEHPDAITLAVNCGLTLPVKDFTELEELLIKEKAQFEVGVYIYICVCVCVFYLLFLLIFYICICPAEFFGQGH
jgi:hypothetical protein